MPEGVATLGADVPVCLSLTAQRMRGVGEMLEPVTGLPPLGMVLVNPGVSVPTPAVFARLDGKENPAMPGTLPQFDSAGAFADWLATQRNDLEAPACALAPQIARVLDSLRPHVRLDWWVVATTLI